MKPGHENVTIANGTPFVYFLFSFFMAYAWALTAGAPAYPQNPPPAHDTPSYHQKPTITLAYPGTDSETGFQVTRALYREAFGRLGYSVAIVPLPNQRSIIETNAGRYDGQVGRVKGFDPENQYPNLIRVREPILNLEVAVFAIDRNLAFRSWEEISEGTWFITSPRGAQIVDQRFSQYIDASRVIRANDFIHAARLLVFGRVDLLIASPTQIKGVLEMPEFHSAGIHKVCVLETIDLFPFLHKRHSTLAPKLARVLREMKQDGSFYKILQEFQIPRDAAFAPRE